MKSSLIILTILLTGFTKGYSCKCYQMGLKNEIDSSDLIFQGIPFYKNLVGSNMHYQFLVEKIWKGTESDTINIITGIGGPDCGMIFEIGKSYVVYSKNGYTSYCRRNSLIDETYDDLKLNYRFYPEFVFVSFTGVDKQLNLEEGDYLNEQFNDQAENFDFKGKSILFTSNRTVINKKIWYQRFWVYDKPVVQLLKLTPQEKEETGYDAILATYCKTFITDRTKKKILQQIK
jgi:hypothetical protein